MDWHLYGLMEKSVLSSVDHCDILIISGFFFFEFQGELSLEETEASSYLYPSTLSYDYINVKILEAL